MSELSWSTVKLVAKAHDMNLLTELMDYRIGDPDPPMLCALIDRAVDVCARRMARFPKELDPLGEDQLTVALLMQLEQVGLDAAHDATSGGHCDIVIREPGGFLWLGEVKKVSAVNNSWVGDGYDQLTVRYATGLPAQDAGALIIFCNCDRIDNVLESWRDFFVSRYVDVTVVEYDKTELWFRSVHPSIKTGLPFKVRHKPISVYFPPLHGVTSARAARS